MADIRQTYSRFNGQYKRLDYQVFPVTLGFPDFPFFDTFPPGSGPITCRFRLNIPIGRPNDFKLRRLLRRAYRENIFQFEVDQPRKNSFVFYDLEQFTEDQLKVAARVAFEPYLQHLVHYNIKQNLTDKGVRLINANLPTSPDFIGFQYYLGDPLPGGLVYDSTYTLFMEYLPQGSNLIAIPPVASFERPTVYP